MRYSIPTPPDWDSDEPWLMIVHQGSGMILVAMPDEAEAEPLWVEYQYLAPSLEAGALLVAMLNANHLEMLNDMEGPVADMVDLANAAMGVGPYRKMEV